MDNTFSTYKIDDRSLVPFIKREIHNLVIASGFSQHRAAEVDIIVLELTSNLIKYTDRGELLYRSSSENGTTAIEIYCLDDGTGIENIGKIMNDGYSSSNTLGQGLGAIKRLSNDFQIYSIKGWGTVQYVKIYSTVDFPKPLVRRSIHLGAISVNSPGENVCGDGFGFKNIPGGFQIFVGDGLGHGANAHIAVQMAKNCFMRSRWSDPVEILREMHEEVKKSRGLVATIATVDFKAATWNICGIGNISTRVYHGLENKTYTPYNGIVGHNIPRTITSTTIPYKKHQMIIMHSDGLRTRWNLSDFISILKQDPEIISAALYKSNTRRNDDATVLVGKII